MNFWEFLDKQIGRLPGWPDGRGLVAVAMVSMTVMILWMVKDDPDLRNDEFFKVLAGAIVITGLLNSVVAYFFGQNHASEQMAQGLTERQAIAPTGTEVDPVHVEENKKK